MECQQESNKQNCICTYPGCPRKGFCCECIQHHLKNRELPACCFSKQSEASFDRSFARFAKDFQEGKI